MTTNHAPADAETQPARPVFIGHGTWKVLRAGSTVAFHVKKMGLYHVKGRFRDFDGHIEFAPESSSPSGEVTLEAKSVSTRMPPRDWHLRTNDFLAAKQHPRIRVRAARIEPDGHGALNVPATIEIRGRAAQVDMVLHVHRSPKEESARSEQARLHLHGVIDRHQFGIKATPPAEWVVASDVHIEAELLFERVG